MKKIFVFFVLILSAVINTVFGQISIDVESELPYQISEWKYEHGDQLEWSQTDFDDSTWKTVSLEGQRIAIGIIWLRASVLLKGNLEETKGLRICIYDLPTAFEVYWDGELIRGNGNVGSSKNDEVPGNIRFLMPMNQKASEPGLHLLAIRVSNFRVEKGNYKPQIHMVHFDATDGSEGGMSLDFIPDLGLFLTAIIFSLLIYLGGFRYLSLVFFGGYALFNFLEEFWIFSLQSNPIKISLFYSIEPFISIVSSIAFLLLNLFVLFYFDIKRKWIHIGVLLVFILVVFISGVHLGDPIQIQSTPMIFYAFGLTLSKWRSRNISYVMALLGIASILIFYVLLSLNTLFSITLGLKSGIVFIILRVVFLSFIMGSISFKIKEQLNKYQEIQLRSQRLETELLKKSIQPHFIMNTLLSIKSWLSKDSAKAEKLIESFADEFRIINRIASKKMISLDEEISLCRHHLKLMGYRRDASYRLIVDNACKGAKIPPMVFHTLIENGLTHAFNPKENGEFRLRCVQNDKKTIFILQNGGSRIKNLAGFAVEKIEEGLGLRYIRARLEESFPGKWNLNYGSNETFWEVQISIQRG